MRTALFLALLSAAAQANALWHHQLEVTLDPESHLLNAIDIVSSDGSAIEEFYLHRNLRIIKSEPELVKVSSSTNEAYVRYRLQSKQTQFRLQYQGQIHDPAGATQNEYARSFAETSGTINKDGVFLSSSSFWYPTATADTYLSFSLKVQLPQGWSSVSQGVVDHVGKHSQWTESNPQQEIYLIAGQFHHFSERGNNINADVFLRSADAALANQYLQATNQYLQMYQELLGPYPYEKFALVENFWETGYGMPSFTLLGPRVIRLPFIIHSSYPHEILHNWWGNSVYVDYQSGNWAEGLTAYLADHLINQQKGQGIRHRRQILQHYTDYVSTAKDFPLSQFRSRHSSASEAIGYGKTQMLFHMLRLKLGDEKFSEGLRVFYKNFRYKQASFKDLQNTFSSIASINLKPFFEQWVLRSGAPVLRIKHSSVKKVGTTGFQLNLQVEQTQQGKPYLIDLPIGVALKGDETMQVHSVKMDKRRQRFQLTFEKEPVELMLDPRFDVFRRVDVEEIPPALSQAFGAEEMLFILPSRASTDRIAAYKQMVQSWKHNQSFKLDMIMDTEIDRLPTNKNIWLLGWQNRFIAELSPLLKSYNSALDNSVATINGNSFDRTKAIVLSLRQQDQGKHSISWLASDNLAALPGLARKLPHYRRYSYLVFEGDEPENVAKGQWPVVHSPMQKHLNRKHNQKSDVTDAPALIQAPTIYSKKRMMRDITALSSVEMQGRGLGSEGLDKSAQYIATQFQRAGLLPGADDDSYFQQWQQSVSGLDKTVKLQNIIGYLPGSNPSLKDQSLVISAHYDHLGLGWPDVRKGNQGKIHPGADDNASGVALMLELARAAKNWNKERSLVFVAFTGEEANKLGSRYYVENYKRFATKQSIANINLDTIGRLGDNPISVFATGSASEWVHIFRGAQFVTGINVKPIKDDIGGSDQSSFLQHAIPAVQMFATQHADFHAPGDTADKIDQEGLLKFARVIQEAAIYLLQRPHMLSVHGNPVTSTTSNGGGRTVSLGSVPDFAFAGPGVQITGVVPKSDAEGKLLPGDILLSLDDVDIRDLRHYASLLRQYRPQQTVTLKLNRNGKMVTTSITLKAR